MVVYLEKYCMFLRDDVKTGGGGYSAVKHTPPLGQCRGTPTINGTKFPHAYPQWHKILANIHTLSGTEMCRKGTLAVAYAYCSQWE